MGYGADIRITSTKVFVKEISVPETPRYLKWSAWAQKDEKIHQKSV
jgi:hypothetical protein